MNNYIDNEIILQRKISPIVYVYIMIIIVIFLSLIIYFILFRYKTYYRINGIVVEDSHYYIRIYVPLDDMKYITENDIVFIEKEKYKYKIISIDDEYFTDNIITYQILKIGIEFPEKYKFNNLNLKLKFVKENKRIIDFILRK